MADACGEAADCARPERNRSEERSQRVVARCWLPSRRLDLGELFDGVGEDRRRGLVETVRPHERGDEAARLLCVLLAALEHGEELLEVLVERRANVQEAAVLE